MDERVKWWERWLTECAAAFFTAKGFHRFLVRRRLEISQQLTVIRRTDSASREQEQT